MKLSVIMATYKCEQYVLQQLDSICRQTRKPDEVIIADDRSPDRTVDIIQEYIAENHLDFVRIYVNEQNKGHYRNFLDACTQASGDILCFSDQDDLWNLNKLERIEQFFQNHPDAACLETGTVTFSGENAHDISLKQNATAYEKSIAQILTHWGSGYQMAFRTEVIQRVMAEKLYALPGFDYHDILLAYFSVCHGSYWVDPAVMNYHRLHTSNVTLRSDYKVLQDTISSRRQLIDLHNTRITSLMEYEATPAGVQRICQSTISLNNHRLRFLAGKWLNLGYMLTHIKYYHSIRVFLADIYCRIRSK